jgi:FkbM family methyltransferase
MLPRISRVCALEGEYLVFSTGDLISTTLLTEGEWEPSFLELAKLFTFNVSTPLVLDVGAHLGAFSVPISKHIQQQNGRVVAFEPMRIVYYQLCGNIFLNRLDNCFAVHAAVGREDGFIEIPEIRYSENTNTSAFSLDKKYRELHGIEDSIDDRSFLTPLVCLDNYEFDSKISLIKLDVEGRELDVLKGSVGCIRDHGFPPIIFEAWGSDWFELERKELLEFVEGLGYGAVKIGPSEYVAQHSAHPVKIEFFPRPDGRLDVERIQ